SRSTISMRFAPASIAFSTSSLTAAAGRSMTSPAAMRLTITGGSWRIFIAIFYPIVQPDTSPRSSGGAASGLAGAGALRRRRADRAGESRHRRGAPHRREKQQQHRRKPELHRGQQLHRRHQRGRQPGEEKNLALAAQEAVFEA